MKNYLDRKNKKNHFHHLGIHSSNESFNAMHFYSRCLNSCLNSHPKNNILISLLKFINFPLYIHTIAHYRNKIAAKTVSSLNLNKITHFNRQTTASWGLMLGISILSGCSTTRIDQLHTNTTDETPIQQQYHHVNIPAHDGIMLRATLFQPNIPAHETAPLIIHYHGFGVWRMRAPTSLYGTFISSGKAAKEAWKRGYWVLSVDHRGFGGSGGKIGLLDPNKDIRDISTVIDWATNTLPRLARKEGDPIIGMVGESYGGAAQLLASIQDPRIDAIVPMTTWYDLGQALAPNDHVKTFWASVLVGTSTVTTGFNTGILMQKPLRQSLRKGTLTPEASQLLHERSMAYYCAQQLAPHANTLLIQGFNDTMFSAEHAWQNRDCLMKYGKTVSGKPLDVNMILVQGGHILPTQKISGLPLYQLENDILCDNNHYVLTDTIVDWFDHQLLEYPTALAYSNASDLPNVCITLDTKSGLMTDHFIKGGETFMLPDTSVYAGFSGIAEGLIRPLEWITSWFKRRPNDVTLNKRVSNNRLKKQGGFLRPAFTPLKIADKSGYIFGQPTAELSITGQNSDSILFVSIGLKSGRRQRLKLLSDQVTPLRGNGTHTFLLPAISTKLKKGDTLGLIISGANSQFLMNRKWIPTQSTINGTISIPLYRKYRDQYIAYSPEQPQFHPSQMASITATQLATIELTSDEMVNNNMALIHKDSYSPPLINNNHHRRVLSPLPLQ